MRIAELLQDKTQFLTPGHTVEHAARRMLALNLSLIPICRADGTLVGVIDERDIVVKAVALGRAPELCAVGEILRKEFFRCLDSDEVGDVYARMLAEGVDRAVVVDRAGRLFGVADRARLNVGTARGRATQRRLRRIA